MYKCLSRYCNNLKKSITSEELFHIDLILMNKFGFWTTNKKFNWKLTLISLLIIIFCSAPQCNFLRKALASNDSRSITLCIPEIIYFFLVILTIQNFLCHESLLRELYQEIEIAWKKSLLTNNPEWMIIQSETVKLSNKMSFLFKFAIYLGSFFYCVVPYCIFFVNYNILGIKDQKFNVTLLE